MRILMLTEEYPPKIVGGISRVVYDLSHEMSRNGHEVHVITSSVDKAEEFENDKGVMVHRIHTIKDNENLIEAIHKFNLSIVEYVSKLINNTGKFTIIHAHDWTVAFAAKALKNVYGISLVSTIQAIDSIRNIDSQTETQKYIDYTRYSLAEESDKVICNSKYMLNEITHVYKIPICKLSVIPNGINPDKFNGIERDYTFRRKYALDNEKIIFFVGRIFPEKGADVLLQSVPKILNQFSSVKFIIGGSGPQLEYLKENALSMGVEKNVDFVGFIKDRDLPKLFKSSDIMVIPSLYEPFGIVALEGMISGVPVVVSDTGGLAEIIQQNYNGIKVPPGDSDLLAEGILKFLQNKNLAEICIKNAINTVKKLYMWQNIANCTLDIYIKAIK